MGVRLFGCHTGNSSDVTLAFKDAQVIQPVSMGENDNKDDTDDIDDIDVTDDIQYVHWALRLRLTEKYNK